MQDNTHAQGRTWAKILHILWLLAAVCGIWQASQETALAGSGEYREELVPPGLQSPPAAATTAGNTINTPAAVKPPSPQRNDVRLAGLVSLPSATVKIFIMGGLFVLIGAICIPYIAPYLSGSSPKTPRFLEQALKICQALLPGPQHSFAGASGMVEMQAVPVFQRPVAPYLPGKRPKPAYPRPGDRVLTASPKRNRQLPSETGVVATFFQQSGFVVESGSESELVISSQLARYKQYGKIPVYVMKNAVVDQRHIQAIRAKQKKAANSPAAANSQALAFLIVAAPLEESAYQAIYQGKVADNFTIIPLSHLLVAKSVRHASCAQQLEEKMSASTGSSNLYAMNTPVADPLNFFGRTKIMNQLLSAVGQHQQLAVFGAPKIGKTWLFWQLKERLSAHIAIYVDLQQLPKSCSYLYRKIVDECVRDIGFKYPDLTLPRLQLSWAGATDDDARKFIHDMLTLWQLVQQKQAQTQIILLLDGAEHLLPGTDSGQNAGSQRADNAQSPNAGAQTMRRFNPKADAGLHTFMDTVQQILAKHACVTSVLALASPQAFRTPFPKNWRCERKIALSSLTEEQCNGMITALGAQMGLRYSEEALSRLYYETGGHPYVTRQVCSLIAKNLRRSKMIPVNPTAEEYLTVQVRDIELAINEYVEYKSEYLEEFWHQLLPVEQDLLRMMMANDSCTRNELVQRVQSTGAHDQQHHILQCLTANDLIEKSEGKYAIKMGLFERIIQMQTQEE